MAVEALAASKLHEELILRNVDARIVVYPTKVVLEMTALDAYKLARRLKRERQERT